MTPNPTWCVGVVVPAQDEAHSIARCVHSIRRAHAMLEKPYPLWIVVVADSCSDTTAVQARIALQGDGEVIECEVRSAGAARTLGATAVLSHFAAFSTREVWLSNTDADTHVPLDWLKRHLSFADDGDTGVAGVVELELDTEESHHVQAHFQRTYLHAADGTHSHVHGANLGVRADAYLAVGGWSALALAEDHCLWTRLKVAGWRLRSTIDSRVTTSARLKGRAPGGFADTLLAHMINSDA